VLESWNRLISLNWGSNNKNVDCKAKLLKKWKKFLDCAIPDKRLPQFPNQELERFASRTPRSLPNGAPFFEAIGQKVVCWTEV